MQQDELLRMAKNLIEHMDKDSLAALDKFIRDDVEQDESDYYSINDVSRWTEYESEDGILYVMIGRDQDDVMWYHMADTGECSWMSEDDFKKLKLVRRTSKAAWTSMQ